jgi:hypothetical protein
MIRGTTVLGVGSSEGPPFGYPPRLRSGLRQKQGRLSRKAREGAHPQLFSVLSKKTSRYIPSLNWPTRPSL